MSVLISVQAEANVTTALGRVHVTRIGLARPAMFLCVLITVQAMACVMWG